MIARLGDPVLRAPSAIGTARPWRKLFSVGSGSSVPLVPGNQRASVFAASLVEGGDRVDAACRNSREVEAPLNRE